MSILDWIDVGPVSAERDENLIHYFYDAGVSKKIIDSPRQFLLLGRKGAGKTAVFRHLERLPQDLFRTSDLLVPMSLVNYSWKAHSLLGNPEKAETFSQRDSWRFVIAIESLRAVQDAARAGGRELSGPLKVGGDLLERLFAKPVPSWIDLLGEKLFSLSKIKIPKLGVGLDDGFTVGGGEVSFAEVASKDSLRSELAKNLDNVTSYLELLLRKGLDGQRIFLIFDRLDEAWDATSVDNCRRIITGLIHAADHFISAFSGNIRPIVFLREDIYYDLDLNDKNKLKEDSGSVLMWDHESLEKMILKRLNFFASKHSQPPIAAVSDLFDRKELKSRATPVKYIFQRTFYRPRDVVAFMGKIIESTKELRAQGELQISAEDDKLSADAIYDAEPAYSEYLVNEIKDEWATQVQELDFYLTAFENLGTSIFATGEFEGVLSKKIADLDRARFRGVLRFLFDNSIVGLRVGASKEWRYKCVYNSQRYADAEQFRVHPGLKRHLGLKDSGSGVAQEAPEEDV